jgi:hypothetical protein
LAARRRFPIRERTGVLLVSTTGGITKASETSRWFQTLMSRRMLRAINFMGLVLYRKKCNRMGPRKCILNAAERRSPTPCGLAGRVGQRQTSTPHCLVFPWLLVNQCARSSGVAKLKLWRGGGVRNDMMAAATSPLCYTNGPVAMQHSQNPGGRRATW